MGIIPYAESITMLNVNCYRYMKAFIAIMRKFESSESNDAHYADNFEV